MIPLIGPLRPAVYFPGAAERGRHPAQEGRKGEREEGANLGSTQRTDDPSSDLPATIMRARKECSRKKFGDILRSTVIRPPAMKADELLDPVGRT
jgi:hypothetical protein